MSSFVSKWILAAAVCVFAACDSAPTPPPTTAQSGAFGMVSATSDSHGAGVGDEAAAQLNGWYQRRDHDCGGPELPAFLCSGVTLRATDTKAGFLPWDPSPNASQKGGISASWLRADMNFPDTVFPNGFIFFPDQDVPAGKMRMDILCAFPLDGNTWERPTLQGCGQHRTDTQSRPCNELGITTAQEWIANYDAIPPAAYPTHSRQCGWDVRDGSPATSDRFYQSILARAALPSSHWRFVDEIIIRTWPGGKGADLPIHSFFYRVGNALALNNARYDQERYFSHYGKVLPVIALNLPTSKEGEASFTYNEGDQRIPLPEHVANARPKVLEATGDNGRLLRIDDFYRRDNVTVRVPRYLDMAAGQKVGIRWAGAVAYTDARIVTTVGALDFSVPRAEVIDAIGRTVPVMFVVTRDGNPEEASARLDLSIEAQALDLPAPTIDAAASKVTFVATGIRPGVHTLSMRWAGAVVRDTPVRQVTHDGEQIFDVPMAWVDENRGRTVLVNIAVGDNAGGRYMFSRVLRFQVPGEEVANLRPRVLEASGNSGRLLRIDDFYRRDDVTVRAPEYPGMAIGQEVGIRWAAAVGYTDTQTVSKVGATDFSVPRAEVIDAIGRTVPVTFYVKRDGKPEEVSAALDLAIEAQPFDLPAPTIDAAHTVVSFTFTGIRPGIHALSMRWTGVVVRDTPVQQVTHPGEQTFNVPAAWVEENRGRTVLVNIAVGDNAGSRYMFSRILRLRL